MPFEKPTTAAPSDTFSPSALPATTDMSTAGVSSEATTMLLDITATMADEPTAPASSTNLATTMQSEDWIEYDYYYDEDGGDSTEAPKATKPTIDTKAFTPQVVTHIKTQVSEDFISYEVTLIYSTRQARVA